MRTAALVVTLALAACTHNQRVGGLVLLSASAQALTFCDVRQTIAVSSGGRWDVPAPDGYLYEEMNPLLGSSPGAARLIGSWAVVESAVVWVTGTEKLPMWAKYAILGALVAGETYEVARMTPVVGVCGGRS